jgi:ribosomal protein S15P/S13E
MVLTMSPGLNTSNKMKLIVQSTELLAKESENAFSPDNYEWHNQDTYQLDACLLQSSKSVWWDLYKEHVDVMNLLNLSKKATDTRNIANKTAIELVAYESSSKFKILENNVNLINNQIQNMNKHISNLENDFIEFKTLIIEERKALLLSEERKKNLDKYTNYPLLKIIYWMFVFAFNVLTIGLFVILIYELIYNNQYYVII